MQRELAAAMLAGMGRLTIALVIVMALVAACTTTSFAGLAKAAYVDEVSASAATAAADLRALQDQVAEMQELADRLADLIARLEETQAATRELQQLAKTVEGRLQQLPRETLRELVKSIEVYLGE